MTERNARRYLTYMRAVSLPLVNHALQQHPEPSLLGTWGVGVDRQWGQTWTVENRTSLLLQRGWGSIPQLQGPAWIGGSVRLYLERSSSRQASQSSTYSVILEKYMGPLLAGLFFSAVGLLTNLGKYQG